MSIKYYTYISDTKVDMLLPQIDPGFDRTSETEVSVGIKVAGVSRRVAGPSPDRVARLERVVRYLDEYGGVGTIDGPGRFFRGTLPMASATFTDSRYSFAYFGGRFGEAKDGIEVGLGGSTFHMLGAAPRGENEPSSSLLEVICCRLGGLVDAVEVDPDVRAALEADSRALSDVIFANELQLECVPRVEVEVLGVRLLSGTLTDAISGAMQPVLLGSPLYIAHVG